MTGNLIKVMLAAALAVVVMPAAALGDRLDSVIDEVLANNASLTAARATWEATQERPDIVEALPDPMVTFGYFFHNVETRVGPMDHKFALAQKVPYPGKRSLAATRAEAEARLAMWNYQTRERTLILKAKLAYFELQQVSAMRAVFEEELLLLDAISEAARVRYETGLGQQQELIKVSLTASKIRERLLDLDQQERTALAQLNALSGSAPERPIAVDPKFLRQEVPGGELAIAVAEVYRQELQAAGVAIERDEAGVELAEKSGLPDFTVGVEYTEVGDARFPGVAGSGDDALMAFVSVNLPIWRDRVRAQVREAEKKLQASRAMESDIRREIAAEVHAAWFHARIREEQIDLYHSDLIPQAEQSLESVRAGYRAARVSFLDVLDSQRVLLGLRLGLITAETDFAKSLASMERSVGVDLELIPELGASLVPAGASGNPE